MQSKKRKFKFPECLFFFLFSFLFQLTHQLFIISFSAPFFLLLSQEKKLKEFGELKEMMAIVLGLHSNMMQASDQKIYEAIK